MRRTGKILGIVPAVAAALALAACSGSGSGGRAHTPDANATATGNATATAIGAARGTGGATARASSSASSVTATGSPRATVSGDTCQNAAVSAEVKTAVTRTFARTGHDLVHFQASPGTFLYGMCGTTQYAATRFEPTAGATTDEQVQFQDEGASRKYFTFTPATGWTYTTSDGFPAAGGCASAIPESLAATWNHCA